MTDAEIYADDEVLPYVVPPEVQLTSRVGKRSRASVPFYSDEAKKLRSKKLPAEEKILIRRHRKVRREGDIPELPGEGSGKMIVLFTYEAPVQDAPPYSEIAGFDQWGVIAAYRDGEEVCWYEARVRKLSVTGRHRYTKRAPFKRRKQFLRAVKKLQDKKKS